MTGRVAIATIDRIGENRQRRDERALRLTPEPFEFARSAAGEHDESDEDQGDRAERCGADGARFVLTLRPHHRPREIDFDHVDRLYRNVWDEFRSNFSTTGVAGVARPERIALQGEAHVVAGIGRRAWIERAAVLRVYANTENVLKAFGLVVDRV